MLTVDVVSRGQEVIFEKRYKLGAGHGQGPGRRGHLRDFRGSLAGDLDPRVVSLLFQVLAECSTQVHCLLF